jgi:hypothetical protein
MGTPLDDSAMTPKEVAAALRMGLTTFYRYQAQGRFTAFELVPRIGDRRYSRKAVQAYLDREHATPRRVPTRAAG